MHYCVRIGIAFVLLVNCCGMIGECDPSPYYGGGTLLASPLVLDDIGDDSPTLKHIALLKRAEIFLQMELHALGEFEKITTATDTESMREAFKDSQRLMNPPDNNFHEDFLFDPVKPKAYFNNVKHIGGHIFMVPIFVPVDVDGNMPEYQYALLFSNLRNPEDMFPTVVCPAEQVEKYRDRIAQNGRFGILPRLTERDRQAIERYVGHDSSADPVKKAAPTVSELSSAIEVAWQEGNMLMDTDPYSDAAQACYRAILHLSDGIVNFELQLSAETWYKICAARIFVRRDYTMVLSFFKKVAEYHRFSLSVAAHDGLVSLYLLAHMMDPMSAQALEGTKDDFFEYYLRRLPGDLFLDEDRETELIDSAEGYFYDMIGYLRRIHEYKKALELHRVSYPRLRQLLITSDPGSLQVVFDTTFDQELAITKEEEAWNAAGIDRVMEKKIADAENAAEMRLLLPFSAEAQAFCKEVLSLTEGVKGFTMAVSTDTWYRICYARLFGAFDSRFVVDFFDFVISRRGDADSNFFSTVVGRQDFIKIYLTACILDHEGRRNLPHDSPSLFRYYMERLYGQTFADDAVRTTMADRVRKYSFAYAHALILEQKKRRDLDAARRSSVACMGYLDDSERGSSAPTTDCAIVTAEKARELHRSIIDEQDIATVRTVFARSGMDRVSLTHLLRDAGLKEPPAFIEDGAIVLSERVTFNAGFGARLDQIARTGMKIIVVATTPEQRNLIDAFNNRDKSDGVKVEKVPNLDYVNFPDIERYYYFMMEGDPEPDQSKRKFTPVDITAIAKKIMENLKKIIRLSNDETAALDRLIERFRQVGSAA